MEYQCNHIQELIDTHRLDTTTMKSQVSGKFHKNVPILHELHRDSDGYMTTRERDRRIEVIHCPACGQLVDLDAAKQAREDTKDEDVRKHRTKHSTWCPFCDQEIEAQAVATISRRHFLYLCPLCGANVALHKARRTVDKVAGVIQGPKRNLRQ